MRVLVISNMYPTREQPVGGIFVHEQVKALRRSGLDVRVLSGKPLWLSGRRPRTTLDRVRTELAGRRRGFAWETYDGVPCHTFNYFAGAFAQPWVYPWVYRDAVASIIGAVEETFPYDLVHTHTAFLDGRAGAAAARRRGVPLVLTEHTGPFSLVTERPTFRVHTQAGMRAADRVIAVSRALQKEIRQRIDGLDESRLVVVPNGVDTGFFSPEAAAEAARAAAQAVAPAEPAPERPAASLAPRGGRRGWHATMGQAKTDLVLTNFIVGLREALNDLGDRPVTGDLAARIVETATTTGLGEGPYVGALAALELPTRDPVPASAFRTPDERWHGTLRTAKREIVLSSFIVGLREAMVEAGDRPLSGRELARAVEAAAEAGIGEGPYADALAEHGLPRRAPAPAAGEEAGEAADEARPIRALWVGHLVEVKRVDRLLEAFAIAHRYHPRLRLTLVGHGHLEVFLRERAGELGIRDLVSFEPAASRAKVRAYMDAADFLVISSETETFGIVGIEALAMGRPVLATDCGGPADYVTSPELGELVPNTTEDLAIGLQRMCARLDGFDPAAIRAHAVERFDFASVAARLRGIYDELLAGRR